MKTMPSPLTCFAFFFCSCRPVTVPAQFNDPYNFKFRNYTVKDGLVHNFVRKCQSDSKGFLWVITQNGLSRFDGFRFQNFQNLPGDSASLPYNDLADLTIDKQDRIWLAYKSGLCFYDPQKGGFVRLNQPLTAKKMQGVCYDAVADKIWATSSDDLLEIDPRSLHAKETALKGKFRNGVSSVTVDSRRRLWVTVHRGGVFCYDTRTNRYTEIAVGPWPLHVYEDYDHQLWVSAWDNGFQKFDGATTPPPSDVHDLPDKDAAGNAYIYQAAAQAQKLTGNDVVWVALHEAGLGLFSISQKRFIRHILYNAYNKSGIVSNYNNYLYEAPDGILWICTWFGLTKAGVQEQQFRTVEVPELNLNMYNCISGIADDAVQPGIAWMSVNGEGILRYDLIKKKLTNRYYFISPHLPADDHYLQRWTRGLVHDNSGALWTVSYGGFMEMKKDRVVYHEIKHNSRLLYADEMGFFKNSLWLMGFETLARFDPASHRYQTYALPDSLRRPKDTNDDYESFCDGGGDSVFVGSRSGLFLLNLATKTFSRLHFQFPPGEGGLWTGCNDLWKLDGTLYVAADGGLAAIDLQTKQTQILGREEGILKLEDDCLFADKKKRLWLYSSHGLYCYTPQTKTFRKFTTADGLYNSSADLVNLFQYRDDIYIGYRGAYTHFNPDKIDENTSVPVPFITAVNTNEDTGFIYPQQTGTLQLGFRNNGISFGITAIEYNSPERLRFYYKLDGFDTGWTATSARTINYTNIPAGRYRFLLKAKNSSGLWSREPAMFGFEIATPFWRKPSFVALCLLVLAGAVYALFRRRVRQIRKREEQKTAAAKIVAELEMRALRSQMNPHFIFNSLNSIQKYIWEAKREDAAEYLTKFARLIRAILENSAHKLVPLSKELALLKLYLELEHRRSNQKFDYGVSVEETMDAENILMPPLLLQPYIENAIWHGLNPKKSRGELTVSIRQSDLTLVCTVDDNGIGRQASQKARTAVQHMPVGLNISAQRIALMQNEAGIAADVSIIDKRTGGGEATGTTAIIVLPLIVNHA